VLVTSLVISAAGVALTASPAAAITGCPQGTSANCYAVGRLIQYDDLHAIGANLKVNCLAVTDRTRDFANFEMWLKMQVNQPASAQNFMEAGMTAGTLGYSPGHETGFMWFWGDYRGSTGAFYEHYIRGASANVYSNLTFRWEGGTSWGIYNDGLRYGITGVGVYPGNADLGGETTSYRSAIWGYAFDWQYQHANGSWSSVTPVERVTDEEWLNVQSAGANSDHTAYVNTWSPHWKCGGSPPSVIAAAPPSANTSLGSTNATESMLRETIGRVAHSLKASTDPTLQYVKSTRDAATRAANGDSVMKATGSTITPTDSTKSTVDDSSVYVVQARGKFTKNFEGRGSVHGNVLEVVIDANTGQVTDWGISSNSSGLISLGTPRSFT
jgi:hypothetical protein